MVRWQVARRPCAGFALVTAMLVSLMVAAIALAFTTMARQKLAVATTLTDQASARLQVDSATAEVLFRISTRPWGATGLLDAENLQWNFFGEAFALDSGVSVELRDTAAMVGLVPLDPHRLRALLKGAGLSPQHIDRIADSVQDWVDRDSLHRLNGLEAPGYAQQDRPVPRDFHLQMMDELQLVAGMDAALFARIRDELTYYGDSHFNPLNASATLLTGYLDAEQVGQVLQLRREGRLTRAAFSDLTGIRETEFTAFFPGRKLEVRLSATVGKARVTRRFVVSRRETGQGPFAIIAWI